MCIDGSDLPGGDDDDDSGGGYDDHHDDDIYACMLHMYRRSVTQRLNGTVWLN